MLVGFIGLFNIGLPTAPIVTATAAVAKSSYRAPAAAIVLSLSDYSSSPSNFRVERVF